MTAASQPGLTRSSRGRGRWIGTPYRHQASCRGAGTDCLGLLRGVWREVLGPEPEAVPAYTPDWSEPARGGGPAGGGGAAPGARSRPATARPGDVVVLRMRDGGVAKHVGILARSRAGARDADPCLFRARRGRVAADAGLVAADRRRLPLSRQEDVMATLLLAAAGSALGGAVGGSFAGLGAMALGKAAGAVVGSAIDQRLLGAGLGAGGDRAGRAVPGHGVERGRGAARGSSGGCRVAGQLIWSSRFLESVNSEQVGGKGGGGADRARVQLFGEPRDRALRGRGVADRADLGGRAGGRAVGADLPAASRDRGPAARSADRGDRGRGRRRRIAGRPTWCSRTWT